MSFSQKQHKENLEKWATSRYAALDGQYSENMRENIPASEQEGLTKREDDLQKSGTLKRKFVGRIAQYDGQDNWVAQLRPITLTDYWTATNIGTGTMTLPENHDYLNARSNRFIRYGNFELESVLPDLSAFDGGRFYFGFERGQGALQGYAGFHIDETSTLRYELAGGGKVIQGDISDHLPSDYDTARHNYVVRVMENMVEFSIDGELVAVALDAPMFSQGEVVTSPPYAIHLLSGVAPKSMPVILELSRSNNTPPYRPKFSFDIGAGDVRFSHDSPKPPRLYRLHDLNADTLLTSGTYDTGASHKSHPVPVYGRENKSFKFRADTDSVTDGLVVEEYTQEGNWRTYETRTYTAGDLEVITPAGEAVLMRIGYEPSGDGASITDAEAVVR